MTDRAHTWWSEGVIREIPIQVGVDGPVRFVYGWVCNVCGAKTATQGSADPGPGDLANSGVGLMCPRTSWERIMDD